MMLPRPTVMVALCLLSVPALSDEPAPAPALGDAAAGWMGAVPETELAGHSGLGATVTGNENSVANAEATGSINGDVVTDMMTTGEIQGFSVGSAEGFNVFQMNTAPNVNQVVSQAINLYIVEQAPTP